MKLFWAWVNAQETAEGETLERFFATRKEAEAWAKSALEEEDSCAGDRAEVREFDAVVIGRVAALAMLNRRGFASRLRLVSSFVREKDGVRRGRSEEERAARRRAP